MYKKNIFMNTNRYKIYLYIFVQRDQLSCVFYFIVPRKKDVKRKQNDTEITLYLLDIFFFYFFFLLNGLLCDFFC